MKKHTPARIVYDACQELGFAVDRYSGRGMYGQECLGFTTSDVVRDVGHLSAFLTTGNSLTEQELRLLFERALEDEMGKEQIVYFPHLKWSEVETKE